MIAPVIVVADDGTRSCVERVTVEKYLVDKFGVTDELAKVNGYMTAIAEAGKVVQVTFRPCCCGVVVVDVEAAVSLGGVS